MYRPDPRLRTASDLRISDADREAAVADLSEHYAAGRLDKDEFDERSDAVWTAKTHGDLAPVFADLAPRPDVVHHGAGGRRGWFPIPFLPALLVLVVLTALTHIPFLLLGFAAWFLLVCRRHCWHRRPVR
jgi:hypothetical protein